MTECASLDEARGEIDRLDREIVRLMAERGTYVRQAARFKKSVADVPAPKRVEAVIAKVRGLAEANGLEPEIAEAAYRAMIGAFIDLERRVHEERAGSGVPATDP